jgi:alkanesulfonate monooxygenase SsuD/methylene tetrahydromethanopterin reductase-like flavin-dependent oxidoreductase (luciferase family)
MVDVLSGGRLEFGLGRGFVVADYEALGIPRDNAQERLLEGLEVILKAWSSRGPFTHRGTHYHYEDVDVWPRPEQQPHPPVWLSCTQSPDSFAYAGRRGFRLLTIAYVAHTQLAELIGRYQEAWQEAGYPAASWEISTHYHTVVAEDGAEARRLAETALRRYLAITAHARQRARAAEPPRNFTDEELQIDRLLSANRTLAGRPDDVVAQLEQARDRWGLTGVDCTFYFGGLSYEQAQRSQHLFATEVMPRVRERERGVDAWRLLSSQTPV